MALTTAERNKRKRERKKRARQEERKRQEKAAAEAAAPPTTHDTEPEVEIEYVPEALLTMDEISGDVKMSNDNPTGSEADLMEDESISGVLKRFQARASVLVSDDETKQESDNVKEEIGLSDEDDEEDEELMEISKRKQRERDRPTVAELKNRVGRADLVEAHDVTAPDPIFLLYLKAVSGTVPVPRHWGRKRKYLQGKRGIEKAPFQLPDFIQKTGISEVRSVLDDEEGKMSAKKKNRGRVAPKMGQLDVDYRTLHDAFFKHQNREHIRAKLTKMGDLYYEGREFETQKSSDLQVGGPLTARLREALDMTAENSPPPWLINMQRFGPPPSYPNLKIPGLNAPIMEGSSYGYHLNGWGKPPVDAFGRPLYGGNPFDAPGKNGASSTAEWDFDSTGAIVTSAGNTIARKPWGALPMAEIDQEDSDDDESSSEEESEDESSGEEMAESDDEEEAEGEKVVEGAPGEGDQSQGSGFDLRKQAGDETPAPAKQLYTVLHQTSADKDKQTGAVFSSDVQYVMPGVPEGAESVLSKVPVDGSSKRKRKMKEEDQDEDDLGKKFKF